MEGYSSVNLNQYLFIYTGSQRPVFAIYELFVYFCLFFSFSYQLLWNLWFSCALLVSQP